MPDPPPIPASVLSYAVAPAELRRENRKLALAWFLLELPALVIPFVAFTYGYSPIWVMWQIVTHVSALFEPGDLLLVFLAFAFFLSLPITYLDLKFFFLGRANLVELWVAMAMALFAAMGTAWICIRETSEMDVEWFKFFSAAIAILLGAIVVVSLNRRRWPLTTHVMFSLLAAYLANSAICVVAFYDNAELGYYFAAYASLVYLAHAVTLIFGRPRGASTN